MRKTRRSFATMTVLTVLMVCLLATTACGNGNVVAAGGQEEESVAEKVDSVDLDIEAQLAGVEIVDHTGEEEHIDDDALPVIDVDGGAVWTDSNPESVPDPESATSVSEPEPESVISEPEPEYQNPGTHGGYLHEVGGARFYTEHDINKWLRPDEDYPEYFDFDIYQMLVDIWCEDGGGVRDTSNGFLYTDGIDFTKGVWFEVLDDNNNRLYRSVKFANGLEEISVEMHDCPRPEGGYYYILDEWNHVLHPDLAPLILYAAEQMVAGSPHEALSALNLGQNFSVY